MLTVLPSGYERKAILQRSICLSSCLADSLQPLALAVEKKPKQTKNLSVALIPFLL